MNNRDVYALTQVLAQNQERPMPAKVAFVFGSNYLALLPIASKFEADRLALIEEHCKLDPDGNPIIENGNYTIDDPDQFGALLDQLGSQEVYSSIPMMVHVDVLGEMTPQQMTALAPMVEKV